MRGAHTKNHEDCTRSLLAIKDALYVLNGKWKLPIILALTGGPLRFKELQRKIDGITARVLSKELKELEQNEFVTRKVYSTSPISVEYDLTPYSDTLDKVILELSNWGMQHRERIFSRSRQEREAEFLVHSS